MYSGKKNFLGSLYKTDRKISILPFLSGTLKEYKELTSDPCQVQAASTGAKIQAESRGLCPRSHSEVGRRNTPLRTRRSSCLSYVYFINLFRRDGLLSILQGGSELSGDCCLLMCLF